MEERRVNCVVKISDDCTLRLKIHFLGGDKCFFLISLVEDLGSLVKFYFSVVHL